MVIGFRLRFVPYLCMYTDLKSIQTILLLSQSSYVPSNLIPAGKIKSIIYLVHS